MFLNLSSDDDDDDMLHGLLALSSKADQETKRTKLSRKKTMKISKGSKSSIERPLKERSSRSKIRCNRISHQDTERTDETALQINRAHKYCTEISGIK
jgi:hypothetical protein